MSRRRVQPTCQTPKTQIRSEPIDDDPIEALIRRSKRQRRKGETRTAVLLLQRACSMDEWRARTFTLLGALLTDVGEER